MAIHLGEMSNFLEAHRSSGWRAYGRMTNKLIMQVGNSMLEVVDVFTSALP